MNLHTDTLQAKLDREYNRLWAKRKSLQASLKRAQAVSYKDYSLMPGLTLRTFRAYIVSLHDKIAELSAEIQALNKR